MSNVRIDAALDGAAQGKTLNEIAELAGVSFGTWCAMLRENNALAQSYASAREIGHDVLADQLLKIPLEQEDVNRARLLSDNIKWVLARRASGKYGDKLSVDISGTVDLTAIMADSAKRLRPMRDLPAIEGEATPIESTGYTLGAPDNVSAGRDAGIDDLLK